MRRLFPELPRDNPRDTWQVCFSRRCVVLRHELGVPDQHDLHAWPTTFARRRSATDDKHDPASYGSAAAPRRYV
ncbi:MAG: hypothetical protein KJZ87_23880 [Thermoguttaceae bacterium]|nr:hypothetical protein [Thermoguttaceae bacterium]